MQFMLIDYRSSSGSGAVILDDCNFHESVRLDNFGLDRTLTLVSSSRTSKLEIYLWLEYMLHVPSNS